jgi:outer membrane protein TolC
VRDSVPPTFPDTTNLRVTVTETAPLVVQRAAEARAAAARVTASRSSYWPSFTTSVTGGYSGAEWPWAQSPQYYDNWSVRLGLRWTLFNGFERERALTQATTTRDYTQALTNDERRGAGATLTRELAALSSAYEQITIARSNVVATTEDLRVQQERYRVGSATFLDLLVSQEALTNAEVASSSAGSISWSRARGSKPW